MVQSPGGKNAQTPRGRKFLSPLHGGPWLVERVFWVFTALTLGGVVLMVSTPFVCTVFLKQKYANAFTFFLMVAGAMMTVFAPAIGFVVWLANRATQTCPECLQEMARGAYVCPWCGFRETPRPEEHP